MIGRALVLGAALAAGCGSQAAPVVTPAPVAAAPAAPVAEPTLADVEAALLAAPAWRADVKITATGAMSAAIDATVLAAAGGRIRVEATGTLMTHPVDLSWVSDGTRTSTVAKVPPALTEAIVVGLVRMGLLHNLARLSAGDAPDHADGGVRDWVVARDVRARPRGDASEPSVIAYGLAVDGKDSADVMVAVQPTPAGPVLQFRRITVHFEQGDMTVDEHYHFDLAPTLAADTFVIR